MKEVRLINNDDVNDYNQIYQEMNVKYSLLKRVEGESDVFRELFPKVICRDYMTDCVAAAMLDESIICGIYGFRLNEKIEMSELLMSVKVIDEKMFKQGIKIIRNLEREFRDLKTPLQVYPVIGSNNNWVIVADKAWLKTPLLMSLFSFLIRCINYKHPNCVGYEKLFKHISNNNVGNDTNYIKSLKGINLRTLIRYIDEIVATDPALGFSLGMLEGSMFDVEGDDSPLAEVYHNNGGVIGFVNNVMSIMDGKGYSSFIGRTWARAYCNIINDSVPLETVGEGFRIGDVVSIKGDYDAVKKVIVLNINQHYISYTFNYEEVLCCNPVDFVNNLVN